MERKNAWLKYDEEGRKTVFEFSERYRRFLSRCKTERECVSQVIEDAKAAGYEDLNEVVAQSKTLNPEIKCTVQLWERVLLYSIWVRDRWKRE